MAQRTSKLKPIVCRLFDSQQGTSCFLFFGLFFFLNEAELSKLQIVAMSLSIFSRRKEGSISVWVQRRSFSNFLSYTNLVAGSIDGTKYHRTKVFLEVD